jgi:multicomponent Na+:H+ antiporter subunit A
MTLSLALLALVTVLVMARALRGVVAAWVGVVALASVAIAALVMGVDDTAPSESWNWVADVGLSMGLRLDGFAVMMVLLVCGLGALVLAYAAAYFDHDATFQRFVGVFLGFAMAMTGLVMAADLFTMFVFWELTSVTSFLLIGLNDRSAAARSAALRALLVTGSGGLVLLAGVVILQIRLGTVDFVELAARGIPADTVVTVGLVCCLVGAFTKSAQFPFHFWLPGAMAAPTPVSAYLHSATMVKAGVVLIARLAPMARDVDVWRWMVVVCGGITMLIGGVRALRQVDGKLLLAHSTVSQLGLLTILFGIGVPSATYAGVGMLLAHALFKASLFLTVGVVDHSTGTRDIRRLHGVGRALPVLAGLAAIATLSMAGIIPALGFATKEKALDVLIGLDIGAVGTVALVAVVLGSVLTVAYSVRLWVGLFLGGGDDHDHAPADHHDGPGDHHAANDDPLAPAHVHHTPGPVLAGPPMLLAALSLAGGLAAGLVGEWLVAPARSLDPEKTKTLVLWAGVNSALVTSIVVIAVGVVLARLLPIREPGPTPAWSGERIYQWLLDGLLTNSRRLTAVTQSGSLPLYTAVVFCVLIAMLIVPWIDGIGSHRGRDLVLADSAAQLILVIVAATLAIGIVAIERRFVTALLAGGIGYSLAGIFLLYGAPDLALTQVLVETLTIVVFLLVLRQMPEGFSRPPQWAPRWIRLAISLAVGIGVAAFAWAVGMARQAPSVAEEYLPRSIPEAGGRNVVNVILVDFRGVDTMGEITVLAVAALGVANLVRAARRDRRRAAVAAAAASTPVGGST